MDPNLKYKLVITYKVKAETHDGYCSDPSDKSVEKYFIVEEFNIPNNLKNKHIDEDGKVYDDEYRILKQFEREDMPHGNGYCSCKTRYTIIDAVVKKRKRKIDLDR